MKAASLRTQRSQTRLLLPALLILMCGCQQRTYEIQMSIEDGRVVRKFVGRNLTAESDPDGDRLTEEEAQLSEAYGAEVRQDRDGETRARDSFLDRLPDDVGGAGNVHQYQSSMGTLSVYLERFRGSDDLSTQIDQISTAVDQLIGLSRKWVEQECQDAELTQKIDGYLAIEGRKDLRNLSLFIWGVQLGSENGTVESILSDATARITQYAVERGYLDFADIPELVRSSNSGDEEAILAMCRRFLARSLATDEARIQRAFPALMNIQTFDKSMQAFQSDDELQSLLSSAFHLRLFGNDRLTVQFKLPRRPLFTNGIWVDDSRVEWTAKIPPRAEASDNSLPTECYAVWCEPNAAFQEARFGRVVLDGSELAEFVLWSAGLSEAESAEWHAFLETITPGDDVAVRLDGFEFSTAADSSRNLPPTLMQTPRRLFAQGSKTGSD